MTYGSVSGVRKKFNFSQKLNFFLSHRAMVLPCATGRAVIAG